MTQNKPRQPVVPGSTGTYAVLPLRDIVVFPHMIVPLFVGREKSIRALEEVVKADRHILLATQIDATDDDPATEAIYTTGTLASVLQLLKLPDGTVKVLVEGASRAQVKAYTRTDEYYEAEAEVLPDSLGDQIEAEALARSVVSEFENYVKLNKKVSPEVVSAVTQIDEPAKLADTIASHLSIKIADKQSILETPTVAQRLEKVLGMMESEISVLQVEKRIRTRVKRQMEKTQREYYLNEQMKAIQKELGDDEGRDELAELEDKIEKTKFTKEARDKALGELKKLRQMSPMSAEATVVRNYLDWMLGIPWGKRSKIKKDLKAAQDVLDNDHYGSRRSRSGSSSTWPCSSGPTSSPGPILCLVGPPASARPRSASRSPRPRAASSCACRSAASVTRPRSAVTAGPISARCPARSSSRCARRRRPTRSSCSTRSTRWAWTSGATPRRPCWRFSTLSRTTLQRPLPGGRLRSLQRDVRDHGQHLNIPSPLLDRMEVIRIAGYTEEEKAEIARTHLIPSAMQKHGLQQKEWKIGDEAPAHADPPLQPARRACATWSASWRTWIRKAVRRSCSPRSRRSEVTTEQPAGLPRPPRYRYGERRPRTWWAPSRASPGPRWAANCSPSKAS
jgi:ATP-dependent Lon protease